MRKIALILLLAGSWAGAANFYVDDATGLDSNNGTTEALAKKTISGGISAVAAAGAGTHVLYIKAGTYGGAYYGLNGLANGTNLTIEGYVNTPGDGASADLGDSRPLLASTDPTFCLYRASGTWAGSSLTLRNLRFAPTSLGAHAIIKWGSAAENGPDAPLLIEYCKFTLPATCTQGVMMATTVAGIDSTRAITLRNCSFIGHASAGRMLSLREVGVVTLHNVDVSGGTAAGGDFVALLDTCTGIDIRGCAVGTIGGAFVNTVQPATIGLTSILLDGNSGTGTNFLHCQSGTAGGDTLVVTNNNWTGDGYGISIGASYTNVAITGYWRNAIISGNTMVRIGTAGGHALMLGLNVLGADVFGNTFKGLDGSGTAEFGAVIKGSNVHFHHNYCWGRYALYVTSGTYNRIVHNSCYGTNGYAFAWSANANTAAHGGTGSNAVTNGTATVTVTGSDLSKVRVGDTVQIVGRTDGIDGTDFFAISAVDDTGDTLTVSPSPGTASGQTWYAFSPPPTDMIVTDNIFDGSGGAFAAVASLNGMHGRIRMDNNLLVAGSGGLASLAGSKADLAAVRATWGAAPWADSSPFNDDNSIAADPRFMGAATGNLALSRISPAIGAASDGSTIGAWQPVPVRRPQRIGF